MDFGMSSASAMEIMQSCTKLSSTWWICLNPKQLEIHGCVLSAVATDALVLKHQAISIHSVDSIFIVLGQFYTEILQL